MLISVAELASKIDHTILKPEASTNQVQKVCEESIYHGVASTCVTSSRVPLAHRIVGPAGIAVCVVIGFPSGAVTTRTKQIEVEEALAAGATEFDMVINLGLLKDGNHEAVERDIRAVRAEIPGDLILKAILESGALSDNELIVACELALSGGANFVKTSTGFHPSGGATIEAVKLMRKTVGASARVKASGGIRDLDTALVMLEAGADRLGTSNTTVILTELEKRWSST